jgi:uncharacterized damage-inducible protein DinB
MVGDLEDPRRTEPAMSGLGERQMLEAWLDFHRATLLLKVESASDDDRKRRPVTTSKLSLHGLVRHMGEVERSWFQRVLRRDRDVPTIWYDETVEDSDLAPLDDAAWDDDLAAWQLECERSRATAATYALDDEGATSRGTPVSLRWIYLHMIEEYARHNGHADLIREMVDGAVGW